MYPGLPLSLTLLPTKKSHLCHGIIRGFVIRGGANINSDSIHDRYLPNQPFMQDIIVGNNDFSTTIRYVGLKIDNDIVFATPSYRNKFLDNE